MCTLQIVEPQQCPQKSSAEYSDYLHLIQVNAFGLNIPLLIRPFSPVPYSNDSGDFSLWRERFIIVNQQNCDIKSPIHLGNQKEVTLPQRISHIKEDASDVLSLPPDTNNLIFTDYLCRHHLSFCRFHTNMSTSCLLTKVKYFIHIEWQKFLKYYSTCIPTRKRSGGDWCSVYIQ